MPVKNAINNSTVIIANLLVIAFLLTAWVLTTYFEDLYYLSVQEDLHLEWATFWAFAAAAYTYILAARHSRATGTHYWLALLTALFCLLVAMEEISWGQRLFNYQPGEYFLAENFQQEANLHNVIDTDYRKLTLKAVILGFGVLLPLLALIPALANLFSRLNMPVPSLGLMPAFALTFLLYEIYPWKHTGEWVELMLGFCFLFAGLHHLYQCRNHASEDRNTSLSVLTLAGWMVAIWGISIVTVPLTQLSLTDDLTRSVAAQQEVKKLGRDLLSKGRLLKCGNHKRVYTYMEKYEFYWLQEGEFATSLAGDGFPERGEYMLDPWNNPYWIRDKCASSSRQRYAFIYSFGPNGRRESTAEDIGGDDIGIRIIN
ncbi:MAG: hypothetical protein ACR2QG_04730 [Gammaproteobacteria bacterium]